MPGLPTDSTDNSRQKKMAKLKAGAGYQFYWVQFSLHLPNNTADEVKLVSKISEFLPITTIVNFLAEASCILHICKSSRSHHGFLFLCYPKYKKVSECFDCRLPDSI